MSVPAMTKSIAPAPSDTSAARVAKAPWRLAILLAVAAAVSGILLTGVSVWFLGAVALAGLGPAALTFNFHTPAALVRLFALTKTACKYGERIVGHRAALLDQVQRRAGLFAAMAFAPATRAVGWQLGNQDRLADYLDDVEDVDYARLRVTMPVVVLLAGIAVLIAATAWLDALALVPIGVLLLIIGIMLHRAMPRMAQRWTAIRISQRSAGRHLGAALAAIVALKAERSFAKISGLAFAHFKNVATEQLAQRRKFAALDMAAGLLGPLAALGVFAAAWHAGARGNWLLVPAFLAFSWLAFGETTVGISRIALARVRERAARKGLEDWSAGASVAAAPSLSSTILRQLELMNVPRRDPNGRGLGAPLNITFAAGHPTALIGASGVGKTTLLKQIAGWIGADTDGRFTGDGVILLTARRRAMSHLCLHDAAILADTIRENLFAPDAPDEACWAVLTAVELENRVAAAGGLDAWIEQDMLSLGEAQRLNLARAILSDAPLVLLDEPVEHLDSEQATRILNRVLSKLADRIVIYSSHDEPQAIRGAQVTL
ncbi:MAG: ATP-binding cassette domain-containing protein [Xanthobacteraceae bacterium]|jgi:ABC-type transport system involved in cytochrome bd biosynthesis fused ATPase/permease subunit